MAKKRKRKNPHRKGRRRKSNPGATNPGRKRRSHGHRRRHNPGRRHYARRHRHNPSSGHHHRRRRRHHRKNPAFGLDMALAPIAGLAANLVPRLLPTLTSSTFNPWSRRIVGGVAAVAGMIGSMWSPRVGAAVAAGGLAAAVGDDLALVIAPKLPHPAPKSAVGALYAGRIGEINSNAKALMALSPTSEQIESDNPDAIGALIGEVAIDGFGDYTY